LMKHMW